MQRVIYYRFLVMFLLFVSASPSAVHADSIDNLYAAAISDARIAKPEEISRSLVGISSPDNKNIPAVLQWKSISGENYILVCTWAGTYISSKGWVTGQTYALGSTDNLWVTASPQLKMFFSSNGFWPDSHAERVLRIEQLLGLPKDNGKVRFIEFWVKPSDLFRPSADPEPSDHEAQLEYPWKKSRFQVQEISQKIHEYVSAGDPNHEYTFKEWFENLNATSYSGSAPYPWTKLGYTYDWADDLHNNGHVGLSEFLVLGGSTIVIEQTVDTDNLENYFVQP
ncbi:hypothetical protein [Desulfovibrio gilichinskyi]|uniref:Uncharacterized protein n=1 Tax=Desulfovibrio gilichinskyi TaxID=1519643 RepID=A0A1X7CZN0_9BACT|nr:hypothetical protein [Desulfovibrio gilichinskyi]SMF05673.1 hypothetical protein SAMN06295933_1449 [Desulfovibrio gilichinskyi]